MRIYPYVITIILTGLIARVVWIIDYPTLPVSDFAGWYNYAIDLYYGVSIDQFSWKHYLFLPYLASLAMHVFGPNINSAFITLLIISTITNILIYYTTLSVSKSTKAALFSTALYAFGINFIIYSSVFDTVNLLSLLYVLVYLFMSLYFKTGRYIYLIYSSTCLLSCTIIRPTSQIVLIAVILILLAFNINNKKQLAISVMVVFVIYMGPSKLYDHYVGQEFSNNSQWVKRSLIEGTLNNYWTFQDLNKKLSEEGYRGDDLFNRYFVLALQYVRNNPREYLATVHKKVKFQWYLNTEGLLVWAAPSTQHKKQAVESKLKTKINLKRDRQLDKDTVKNISNTGILFNTIIFFFTLISFIKSIKEKDIITLFPVVVAMGYLILHALLVAGARYSVPGMTLLTITAGHGFALALTKITALLRPSGMSQPT